MSRLTWFRACLLIALLATLVVGCASDDGDNNQTGEQPDDNNNDPVQAVFEYIILDAAPAPPNPVSGLGTPDQYNKIGFTRVRADTGLLEPREVSAILVLLSGHSLGGNEFFHLARELVEMTEGDVEVWLQERRSHFMEDNHGLQVAEQMHDPNYAHDYYLGGYEVAGKTFGGFKKALGDQTDHMSEWGLKLELADIRQILALVPQQQRSGTVYLGGHSRGVAFAQCYAAHRFDDGHLGNSDLAGLVLIDGGSREDSPPDAETYLEDIDKLRRSKLPRYITFPPVGPPIYIYIEMLAMAAAEGFGDPDDPEMGPDGVWSRRGIISTLFKVLFRGKDIRMTNEALIGMFIDDDFSIVKLLTGHFGSLTGGPMEQDGKRMRPIDEEALYSWVSSEQSDPVEPSDLQFFIQDIFEGPSNGLDRYYPKRLDMDLEVAWYDNYRTIGTWRTEFFDQRNWEVDAPVYALATGLMDEQNLFIGYRDALGPVRGDTRPRTEAGFHMMFQTEWGHMDPVSARREANPFYPDLIWWMQENSTARVSVPEL